MMIKVNSAFWLGCMMFLGLGACSPKVTDTARQPQTPTPPAPPAKEEKLSPCKKFSDVSNGDELLEDYVVYRDFFKLKQYDEAYPLWEKVYKGAPAADGRRWNVYSDGIVMLQERIRNEKDTTKHDAMIDEIIAMYDGIANCYPEQRTYVQARKAFDLYYNYPSRATDQERYQKFKSVIDEKGLETFVFVLNPFTKLMVDGYLKDDVPKEDAQRYAELVPQIVRENLMKGQQVKAWSTVRDYAIPYIERLEGEKGFFDCDHFIDKYYRDFEEVKGDCEEMTALYSKLRFGGCDKEDDRLKAIYQALVDGGCIETKSSTGGVISQAQDHLRNGSYQQAVDKFEEALGATQDPIKKSKINLVIAKIYYAHLKNFSKSRSYAREAAKLDPNDGSPHILIGKLYASSGPLCGPGRGFDSQVVTWPAIDQWQIAKKKDASVAAEANKLIGKYRPFMPSKEDIFQRSLVAGTKFKVGCWIQETTTIRTAD